MKNLTAFILFSLTISASAQFHNPYAARCQSSYFFDSFGHGASLVMTGVGSTFKIVDRGCYKLGMDAARTALSEHAGCKADFKAQFKRGFSVETQATGNECETMGYNAGLGLLGSAAREADAPIAGEKCLKAYAKGTADWKVGATASPSHLYDQVERYCYTLGHYEGELF